MKRIESGKLSASRSQLPLIKTLSDGSWREALRQQPLSFFSSHFVSTLWPSRTLPLSLFAGVFFCHTPSLFSWTRVLVLCLRWRRGGCCCRARSLSFIPMKGTSQGSFFKRDVLTQPQHQPITELSRIAYNLLSFSLFCFILPSEGSSSLTCSQSGERINYPMVQHQSESIAELAQGLLNSGQPSIRSC